MILKTEKIFYGVGVNDVVGAIIKVEELPRLNGKRQRLVTWRCPYYVTWKNMLMRCYCPKYKLRNPSYEGCEVSKEWLLFSNFKKWMEKQDWEGKELDKDILFMNNKEYHPDKCIFVTKTFNSLFLTAPPFGKRKSLLGAKKTKFNSFRVRSTTRGRVSWHGTYKCEMEAHTVWKNVKIDYFKELISELSDERLIGAIQQRIDFLQKSIEENTPVYGFK